MSRRIKRSFLHRHGPLMGGIFAILLCVTGAWWSLRQLGETQAPLVAEVQQISIVQPPPPPLPPPVVEQPPPPEQTVEELPEPEPEPEAAPDEPPPGDDLGLDADGVAGSDGFGLAAKRGGRGLIGGGSGNAIIWYGQKIGSELSAALRTLLEEDIRNREFSVLTRVWVRADGRIERAELAGTSGDAALDVALSDALTRLSLQLPQAPPADMPQPVKIRLDARG